MRDEKRQVACLFSSLIPHPSSLHLLSTTSTTTHETLSREPLSSASWPRPSAHSCTLALSFMKVEQLLVGDDAAQAVGAEQEAVAGLERHDFHFRPFADFREPRYFHSTLR